MSYLSRILVGIIALMASVQVLAEQRIVSIDGSITEIIYALEAQQNLVGVDTTSRYPQAATELPQVGYMRQLSVEGILSLRPTTVIATTDAGPESVFTKLSDAGVKVVRIKNQYNLEGVTNKIHEVGKVLGKTKAANLLASQLELRVKALLEKARANTNKPKTLFILGAGERGLMAAGRDTQAQAMLDMLGAKNAMQHKGYKPISREGILKNDPEVVLIAHTGPTDMDALKEKFAMTKAEQNNQIHTIDTIKVLGFGPRIDQGIEQLILALYPKSNP